MAPGIGMRYCDQNLKIKGEAEKNWIAKKRNEGSWKQKMTMNEEKTWKRREIKEMRWEACFISLQPLTYPFARSRTRHKERKREKNRPLEGINLLAACRLAVTLVVNQLCWFALPSSRAGLVDDQLDKALRHPCSKARETNRVMAVYWAQTSLFP